MHISIFAYILRTGTDIILFGMERGVAVVSASLYGTRNELHHYIKNHGDKLNLLILL